ncbi:hypothetical protein [Streptomyces sp. NPDC058092]|uniref:hypothetical protein n=1 Tax=Streptomyces sp. NPDC058092 TaxID=3346336 RepID=UPI0036E33D16
MSSASTRLLVGGSADGTVRVWDVDTPGFQPARERHPGAVAAGVVGGRRVWVSATGDEVWARETTTGRVVRRLAGGRLGITALLLNRLGRRPVAVTAGADWTVRVWDVARGQAMGRAVAGHTGSIEALAVARLHGRLVLLTGGSDSAIAAWDLMTWSLTGTHPTAHDAARITYSGPAPGSAASVRQWSRRRAARWPRCRRRLSRP